MEVIQSSPSAFRKEVAGFFTKFGLNLALRIEQRELEIQKNLDGFVHNYPYSLTADTLQQLIFYLAAIESNDDAILLFEEPEAHSYPVYVSQLARRIVESRNNQFFVVTHSSYLITEVLEEMLTNDDRTYAKSSVIASKAKQSLQNDTRTESLGYRSGAIAARHFVALAMTDDFA